MKPGLAILPMDVWADVFVYPWNSRQKLAQIVHRFKERAFAEKLQMFLHDPRCGKHALRFLKITYKHSNEPKQCKYQLGKQKIPRPKSQASLAVAPHDWQYSGSVWIEPSYKDCKFPENEMPENIRTFKRLSLGRLDDQVLDLLGKIKPLFTNVYLNIGPIQPAMKKYVRILFGHLLPMLGGIRGIHCDINCMKLLEHYFPGTLARAKELHLPARPASIPAYLDWLNAPQDFGVHGPRLLIISAEMKHIPAIAKAVIKQFLAATTQATFVIFFEFTGSKYKQAKEQTIQNAATNEQLCVRNGHFERPAHYGSAIHYVEILRHQIGAEAKMREWIERRAYYGEKYGNDVQAEQVIWIARPTIGSITKNRKLDEPNQAEYESNEHDNPGPSTSAARK